MTTLISTEEILSLYKKVNVKSSPKTFSTVRSTINTGTLTNLLAAQSLPNRQISSTYNFKSK